MKKILLICVLCIIAIYIVFLFCSCVFFGPQEYTCDIDKVKSIEIIILDKYVEGEYRFDYTVICPIFDHTGFVNRLNKLEQSKNWGDPQQMYVGYVVIRIEYLNGDFDLLHSDAQCFNRSGENEYGYFFFDDAQFGALISDYVAD